MRKYQLKLVTMYMPHSAQTLRLVKMARHGTPSWAPCGARPDSTSTCSAALVEACSRGWFRNHQRKTRHHNAATPANNHNACRQLNPPSSTSKTQMNGVRPPMNRADSQSAPWANPRSVDGNQL